jgi:hypothetical protein
MPAPHISQWLSQALGSYRTRDAVQRDVELALDTYPSLKIKTDQYSEQASLTRIFRPMRLSS